MKEVIVRLTSDHIRVKGGEYVQDLVRCGRCKWFGHIGCAIRIVDDSDKPTENDFCSFGEVRDE